MIRFIHEVFRSTKHDEAAQRYDTDQPWICWHFLTTDARTRILGRSAIRLTCCVCGETRRVRIRIPRFGPIPDRDRHPERSRFMLDHLHRDRPHIAAWALPFRNPAAWTDGIDFDLIAMRLEADLNKEGLK